jgi:hypothetical protein
VAGRCTGQPRAGRRAARSRPGRGSGRRPLETRTGEYRASLAAIDGGIESEAPGALLTTHLESGRIILPSRGSLRMMHDSGLRRGGLSTQRRHGPEQWRYLFSHVTSRPVGLFENGNGAE